MYNKNIKLLVLDIDGTLVDDSYKLHQPVIDSIKKVRENTNIIIMLATGRMTISALPIANQLKLTTPLIAYQGAMVKDIQNNKILFHQYIDNSVSHKIIKDLEKENIQVNIYVDDQLYVKQLSEISKYYSSTRYITANIIDNFNIIDKIPATKILGLDYDIEKIEKIKKRLKIKYKNHLNIFSSCKIFIEIVNPQINKGKTVFKVAKDLWDISPQNIMTIGDGENDLDMIQSAKYGVAMGNAIEEVKKVASFTTKSIDQHGVAAAIEEIIFKV